MDEGLDERVPLLDHGAALISGDIHAIEVSIAVEILDFFDLESELLPGGGIGGVVAITKGKLEDSVLKIVSSILKTSSLVTRSQSDASLFESWS